MGKVVTAVNILTILFVFLGCGGMGGAREQPPERVRDGFESKSKLYIEVWGVGGI